MHNQKKKFFSNLSYLFFSPFLTSEASSFPTFILYYDLSLKNKKIKKKEEEKKRKEREKQGKEIQRRKISADSVSFHKIHSQISGLIFCIWLSLMPMYLMAGQHTLSVHYSRTGKLDIAILGSEVYFLCLPPDVCYFGMHKFAATRWPVPHSCSLETNWTIFGLQKRNQRENTHRHQQVCYGLTFLR